ncbi:MAG TPA: phytoene/squalene synthase family protein [Chitinophagaceae bacterium]|nr:phytoene/squalene synthase family protein [Chitinophagaceae bacterium]
MMHLFHEVSKKCSRIIVEHYSTSFSSAIKLLHKSLQPHIYNIYGFVRFADEIVDTFHQFDKATLLAELRNETYAAIERKISINPILHSFQLTVNHYKIDPDLIDAFFNSMELDLHKRKYNADDYAEYIYGSAATVGLMCLYVFCEDDKILFDQLKSYAMSLGVAFQKVNFLRDIKNDFEGLNRIYFPRCNFMNFSDGDKKAIQEDIQKDFDHAYKGIMQLPVKARLGVYVAYKYYFSLFKKIKRMPPHYLLKQRVRIPNYGKAFILAKAGIRSQLNIL